MLLNDFYSVRDPQQSDDSSSCIVVFNGSHEIFNGHFPSQPVVPGVCMMQMIKELMQRQLNKQLLLHSAGQVKFLQLITPEISPEVHLSWKAHEPGYLVNASFRQGSDLFKFSGLFKVV